MMKRIKTNVSKHHILQLRKAMDVLLNNNVSALSADSIATLDVMAFIDRNVTYVTFCDMNGNMVMTMIEDTKEAKDV